MTIRQAASITGTAALLIAVFILPLMLDPNLPGELPLPRVLLNVLPLGILALLVFGLTRRPILSTVWLFGLAHLLFFVNQLKLTELQEPVVFNDVLLMPQVITGFDLLGSYVNSGTLLLAAFIFLALCVIGWKWERPIFGWVPGLAVFTLSGLMLSSLDSAEQPLGSLYHSDWITARDWEARENVKMNGLIATLVRSSSNMLYRFPEVDPGGIRRPDFLPDLPAEPRTAREDYPDIVVVLSESFFDPLVLNEVEPCDYLARWCELKSSGQAGWLVVPTYGGNTPRSEFELLTGIPFSTFGGMDYPYVSVVNSAMYSIPWYLKSMGYRTTAIHTNSRTFWRRQNALPRLGFDKYIALEDIQQPDRVGFWPADSVLTEQVLALFEPPEQDRPQFVLAISMENHGPWNENRRSRLPESVADITLPVAAAEIPAKPLQQYLWHAENVVTELERLWQFTRQRSRKTVLIFFGDHLPALNDSFKALGFDNGKAAFEQLTPYLVLSNFPLRAQLPQKMHLHQMLVQALYAAGLPLGESYGNLRAAYIQVLATADGRREKVLDEYLQQLQTALLHVPMD